MANWTLDTNNDTYCKTGKIKRCSLTKTYKTCHSSCRRLSNLFAVSADFPVQSNHLDELLMDTLVIGLLMDTLVNLSKMNQN